MESIVSVYKPAWTKRLARYLAVLPPLSFVIMAALLSKAHRGGLWEAPFALLGLNTLFLSLVPLLAAYFAARSYVETGSSTILSMGCGLLAFGFTSFLAGWTAGVPDGVNDAVTIFNAGALLASIFHVSSAGLSLSGPLGFRSPFGKKAYNLAVAYSGVLSLVGVIFLSSREGLIPVFFVQGQGPTALRQLILGLAVTGFGVSAFVFMLSYFRTGTEFLYWYSLSLLLIMEGLATMLFLSSLGSPLNWMGRSFQYTGGIYFLIALVLAFREARSRGLSIERALSTLVDVAELRKAEEALHRSESKYRELVQNANSAILRWRSDGTLTFFNEYAQFFFGYTEDEVLGRHVNILVPEKESNGRDLTRLARDIVQHPERYTGNINENIRRDGRRAWMAWTNKPVLDRSGEVNEILAVGTDITERKLAEDQVRLQNAVLEGINRVFKEALTCETEEELGVLCLRVAEDLTGSRFGFIGEIGSDGLLHDIAISDPGWEQCAMVHRSGHRSPLGTFRIHGLYGRVLLDGRSVLTNDPSSHPDSIGIPEGHPPIHSFLGIPLIHEGRTIGVIALGDREGGFTQVQLHAMEAVAPSMVEALMRKRAEEALRESRAKLGAALASMTDAVMISDSEGRFIDFNHAFAAFHRFSNKEACSKTFAEYPDILDVFLSNGEPAPLEQWALPRALRGETVTNAEYTLRRKDTGETWVGSYSFGPIRDQDGVIVGSVVVGRDITDRKRMEDELRESRDELELRVQARTAELETYMKRLQESNQSLQDFASIASHDLQEPLRKVQTFGNMLKGRYSHSLGEKGQDYLDRMLSSTVRMQSLLISLLDYSRVTTKAKPFVDVGLRECIWEVLMDLEVRIHQTGGRLEMGDLPTVHADPTQMRQLFQNLIGNALKFHKEEEKPVVKVSAHTENAQHHILVEDNGIGFDEQYLHKIFVPFQRLHGKSSRYEGTGMGLAICKRIVERHGGTITASSAEGKGSTFFITLPVKRSRPT